MTTSLTLLTNERGDYELHVTGCGDIKRASRRYPERNATYEGDDLLAALIEVDTDAANWFCEAPYTQESRDGGCWAVRNGIDPSPCVTKLIAVAGITFENGTGRPLEAKR